MDIGKKKQVIQVDEPIPAPIFTPTKREVKPQEVPATPEREKVLVPAK